MSTFDSRVVPLLAIACGIALAQPNSSEQDITLRTTSQLVVLNVRVRDSHGNNIRGLANPDFAVYEDGQPQSVKQFGSGDQPVTVGILVDASSSMRTRQKEVAAAVFAFVQASNPKDETFVINFNDRPSLALPSRMAFSSDPHEIDRALLATRPDGKTSLYDAVVMAAEHLSKAKWENKVLLLVSDGGDNNSKHTFADAVRALEISGSTLYSIALFDPDDEEHNAHALKRLSNLTGGESYTPQTLAEVGPLCLRIARDIRDSYTLAYTPPESLHEVRKVKVTATQSAGPKLAVRTRGSYILTGH